MRIVAITSQARQTSQGSWVCRISGSWETAADAGGCGHGCCGNGSSRSTRGGRRGSSKRALATEKWWWLGRRRRGASEKLPVLPPGSVPPSLLGRTSDNWATMSLLLPAPPICPPMQPNTLCRATHKEIGTAFNPSSSSQLFAPHCDPPAGGTAADSPTPASEPAPAPPCCCGGAEGAGGVATPSPAASYTPLPPRIVPGAGDAAAGDPACA